MNFWNRKKVFITGHTGFKGSWLCYWLQSLGATITGYALSPSTSPNLFSIIKIGENMESIIADVRDGDKLKRAVNEFRPDIVFHLAAQPLVRYSYSNPVETYSTNVMGTVHLFEAVKTVASTKIIINITTDKCYENKEWLWGYRENDRLGGRDPYSNSKACAELVTSAYRDSYFREMGIGLACARAGNVIGGGDWALDRLVPDIIAGCLQQRSVVIRNPHAIRPWQHVLEPLNGYIKLAELLYAMPQKYAESWNFGPDEGDIKPVSWIADYITHKMGSSWEITTGENLHEATFLKLDCAKAKSLLGWQPQNNLQKGLDQTIAWYQAYQAGENMQHFTLSQIQSFDPKTNILRGSNHVEAAMA